MIDKFAENEHDFAIAVEGGQLPGRITVPTNAEAIIIFTDSTSRSSAEAMQLAEAFQNQHFGTLQMDLLLEGEETEPELYALLAERVESALDWLQNDMDTRLCDYVLFSRTAPGADCALKVMKDKPRKIAASVMRVELVNPSELPEIPVPTLVITDATPDIEVENLTMAKPGNIIQQTVDWYFQVRDKPESETASEEETEPEEKTGK